MYYLGPVNPGLQFIQSGPYGRGIMSVVGDLITAISNNDLVKLLDKIIEDLNSYPFIKKDKRYTDLSSVEILGVLSMDIFRRILDLYNERLKVFFSKKKHGVPYPRYGRLASFDELGGKKRYIAIGN